MVFFQKKFRSVQEVAKQYDISVATVDYYVNMGLLDVAGQEGNKRLFDPQTIRRQMQTIHRLRNQGYSLRQIQQRLLKEKFKEKKKK